MSPKQKQMWRKLRAVRYKMYNGLDLSPYYKHYAPFITIDSAVADHYKELEKLENVANDQQ